jgi:hypothetical protein
MMGDHISRKQFESELCAVCYTEAVDAERDYEYGLTVSVRPDVEYACRWESRYVLRNNPDEDDPLDMNSL